MRDRDAAERFLNRMLAPMGLGEKMLPLGEAWRAYEVAPNRGDLAPSTLNAKRLVWMHWAAGIEKNHLEIVKLAQLTREVVAEYLAELRVGHCGSTYNGRVCILREVCRVLSDKAGCVDDPWEGVCLRNDDSHSRREFSLDELRRVLDAAEKEGPEWHRLFSIGLYTGLRLGDCCLMNWSEVNLGHGIIQVLPRKTRKHLHGRPVTIPIHAALREVLGTPGATTPSGAVLPEIAAWYEKGHGRISSGLSRIFKRANITTSIRIGGRRTRTPDATFHSLGHTFVSVSANAGVPLPGVQSIVGHCSTAMTRHYYHENEEALRRAVDAIPAVGGAVPFNAEAKRFGPRLESPRPEADESSLEARLRKLKRLQKKDLITEEEYQSQRARILASI